MGVREPVRMLLITIPGNNVNLTSSYKEAYYQLPICVITGCTMIPDLKFPEHWRTIRNCNLFFSHRVGWDCSVDPEVFPGFHLNRNSVLIWKRMWGLRWYLFPVKKKSCMILLKLIKSTDIMYVFAKLQKSIIYYLPKLQYFVNPILTTVHALIKLVHIPYTCVC